MVVCAHLQRVYHWMVTTQTTFCGRKRRLRTEPGSTALTVAGVGFRGLLLSFACFAEMQPPFQNPTSATAVAEIICAESEATPPHFGVRRI